MTLTFSFPVRLRDNFLEQQLEEFNDKSKEIEQALYDKQMEMAGTVFNKHDFMPKHEVNTYPFCPKASSTVIYFPILHRKCMSFLHCISVL